MESTVKERILKICDELGEDMDSSECQALHEYIRTCPNCQAFVDSVRKTINLYKNYTSEYSSNIHTKLVKSLKIG